MGYAHYWENRSFTQQEWDRVVAGARNVIERAERRGITLAGPVGRGAPSLNDTNIAFNGLVNEAFELFRWHRCVGKGFCKTGRMRYDTVVIAVLSIAETIGALAWTSDGKDADHAAGRLLASDFE